MQRYFYKILSIILLVILIVVLFVSCGVSSGVSSVKAESESLFSVSKSERVGCYYVSVLTDKEKNQEYIVISHYNSLNRISITPRLDDSFKLNLEEQNEHG